MPATAPWTITHTPDASRPGFILVTAVSGGRVIRKDRMTESLLPSFDPEGEWALAVATFRAKRGLAPAAAQAVPAR